MLTWRYFFWDGSAEKHSLLAAVTKQKRLPHPHIPWRSASFLLCAKFLGSANRVGRVPASHFDPPPPFIDPLRVVFTDQDLGDRAAAKSPRPRLRKLVNVEHPYAPWQPFQNGAPSASRERGKTPRPTMRAGKTVEATLPASLKTWHHVGTKTRGSKAVFEARRRASPTESQRVSVVLLCS